MTEKADRKVDSLVGLLALLPAGKAKVTVKGLPVISVDADAKTLEVETEGLKEAGLRLSDLVEMGTGTPSLVRGSGKITGALSKSGWKVTLFADGEKMLVMGSGVSRLTGRIRVNPLKLRKLLKALQ
jgi:hypothetical protein